MDDLHHNSYDPADLTIPIDSRHPDLPDCLNFWQGPAYDRAELVSTTHIGGCYPDFQACDLEISRRCIDPPPTQATEFGSTIPAGGDYSYIQDERTPARSNYGWGTLNSYDFSAISEQTKGLMNGLSHCTVGGKEDYEGLIPSSFACEGSGELKENREMSDYKSAGGRSTTHGVADGYGDLILIVQTSHYLCVLDLKGDHNVGGYYSPLVLREINLLEEGFPLRMGIFKMEYNKVYMFGGSIDPYRRDMCESGKMSDEPFYFKLDSGSWSLNSTEELAFTRAPKADPWVKNVDDKILVVEGINQFKDTPEPFIEYFDRNSNTWEVFPKISSQKNWSKEQEALVRSGKYCGVLLIGYKMYIKFGIPDDKLFFCLNTRTKEWDNENAYNMRKSLQKLCMYFPDKGTCVSRVAGLDDNKNIILYHDDQSIYAYLFDNSGYLLCYQDVTKELCRYIKPIHDYGILFVDMKSGGRMCMVLINSMNSIHIRHFNLRYKRESPFEKKKLIGRQVMMRASFVTVETVEDQLFTPRGVDRRDLGLANAVILRNEKAL